MESLENKRIAFVLDMLDGRFSSEEKTNLGIVTRVLFDLATSLGVLNDKKEYLDIKYFYNKEYLYFNHRHNFDTRYSPKATQSFATFLKKRIMNGGSSSMDKSTLQATIDLGIKKIKEKSEIEVNSINGSELTWEEIDQNVNCFAWGEELVNMLKSYVVIENKKDKINIKKIIPHIWKKTPEIAPKDKELITINTPIVIVDKNTSYYKNKEFLNSVQWACNLLNFKVFRSERNTKNLISKKENFKDIFGLREKYPLSKLLFFGNGCGTEPNFFKQDCNFVWYSPFPKNKDCGCNLLKTLRVLNKPEFQAYSQLIEMV